MNPEKKNNTQLEENQSWIVIVYIVLELTGEILPEIIGITNPYLGLSMKIIVAVFHLIREHKKSKTEKLKWLNNYRIFS